MSEGKTIRVKQLLPYTKLKTMSEKQILVAIAKLEQKSFAAFSAGNDKSLEKIEIKIQDLQSELASL
tara:strand:- start:648 stop:848 length:201 start_codon:yes stop_codon:yes gene_type:complete